MKKQKSANTNKKDARQVQAGMAEQDINDVRIDKWL